MPKHKKKHEESETEAIEAVTEEREVLDHHKMEKPEPTSSHDTPPRNPLVHLYRWAQANKKLSLPVVGAALLILLASVPFTRYMLAGLLIKQTLPIVVLDSETGKPVSSATLSLNGRRAQTNGEGKASIRTKVGYGELTITKKYYESYSQKVLITLEKPDKPLTVRVKADGRPVPITVLNYISKQPVAGAVIATEGTEAKTDDQGKAIIVVPEGKKDVEVRLSSQGFNPLKTKLMVTTDEVEANIFAITPSGKIYFLSNASGKIDLVKSNLDGSERQIVLAGTGKEDKNNTLLLASQDWKYIALLSRRDGGEYSKLFLIEAENDKVTTMDEGEASFSVYGWSENRFVYKVNRDKYKPWDSKQQVLKSYDALSKKITALFTSDAEGGQYGGYTTQNISEVFIIGKEIIYTQDWNYGGYGGYDRVYSKQSNLVSIQADGSQRNTIKSYPSHDIEARTAEFGELYIRYYQDNKNKYDEYENGKATFAPDFTDNEYWDTDYFAYSVSPSDKKTLWSENRDGKNVFFVGDSNGKDGKEIGHADEFVVYGWFTDDYVLLTKKGSEMFIMPVSGLEDGIEKAAKISDYYKPVYYNRGFGYGYGG